MLLYFDEIDKQIVNMCVGWGGGGMDRHTLDVNIYPQISIHKFLHYSII